tara:strand:- start:3779 stop:4873 length:1095 start_codon:yes stop_codon:yes gene_type:complete
MTTLKPLTKDDVTTNKTLLHENIPITGSVISGTYSGENLKTYSAGLFTSIYDYPYLSSSANHLFDVTLGVDETNFLASANVAGLPGTAAISSGSTDKQNIYSQMGQLLMGYDATGSIDKFRISSSYDTSLRQITAPMFINFSRLLTKDEIQKDTFRLTLGTGTYNLPFDGNGEATITIGDYGATSSFNDTNSPIGEYSTLRVGSATGTAVGTLYYQAGIAVLDVSQSLSRNVSSTATSQFISASVEGVVTGYNNSIITGTMDVLNAGLIHRLKNVQFNNTTELNSTIYFCRANHNEFNFSSNPTYLSASQIRVKASDPKNPPFSYITTVGMYNAQGALVATAKLSEPIKKTTSNDVTIRVRLDY